MVYSGIFLYFFSSFKTHEILKRQVANEKPAKIVGFRVEKTPKEPEIDDNGIPILRANTKVVLRLFGFGFKDDTEIGLTQEKIEIGARCKMLLTSATVKPESETNALVEILMPKFSADLYLCVSTFEVRD